MLLAIIASLMIFLLIGCAHGQGASPAVQLEARGRHFVELLVKGNYPEAYKQFDSTMKSAMPEAKLREVWTALPAQLGPFKRIIGTRLEKAPPYFAVYVTTEFEKATVDIKVVYNSDNEVSGLWFVPTQAQSPTSYQPPAYAKSDSFTEKEVTIGTGEWQLPGTLTIPKGSGPFPAVVLVHGSGPNDRDETFGPNKPFRDLAWGLASNGVAVLRYDKRTKVYPQKMVALQGLTVKEEVVDDAVAAAQLLSKQEKIDPKRVFVLGHSLGGILAPRIAKADPDIDGIIVMAGSARPVDDVILEQLNYVSSLGGKLSAENQAKLDELKKQIARIKSPDLSKDTPASELPLGVPATYWLDLRGYNPAQAAQGIHRPMLVLQGGRDYQVTEQDFNIWKRCLADRDNVTFKLYPDLNHLFFTGKGKATPAEYEQPGHVSAGVINDIAGWVKSK